MYPTILCLEMKKPFVYGGNSAKFAPVKVSGYTVMVYIERESELS